MGLDYYAIDCAETSDGKLLVFEVDTAMLVHDMDAVELYPYKRPQMRKVFAALPMIAAMKSAMADATGLPDWKRLRPPLIGLTSEQEATLRSSMAQAEFQIAFPRAAA